MKHWVNVPTLINDGYSEEYLDFVKKHNIRNLTTGQQELLQLLVKKKIGGFEKIVKLYRDCSNRKQDGN